MVGGTVVSILAVSGQIFEHRSENPEPAPIVPPPTTNTLSVTNSAGITPVAPYNGGSGTWTKIDTTGLWTSQGGNAPTGSLILINGAEASTLYGGDFVGQPTPSSPIVSYMMRLGTYTIALVPSSPGPPYTGTPYYSSVVDVTWRGAFTSSGGDGTVGNNASFFLGAWPKNTNTPNAGNNWQDGPAYFDMLVLNNGYNMIPASADAGAPAGATYATFCVAPGDIAVNDTSADCRSEPNFVENYSTASPPVGTPLSGIDMIGNKDLGVRFIRLDFIIPASWTAPVVVKNADNAGWAARINGLHPTIPLWPNSTATGVNPTNSTLNSATAVVTNTAAAIASLSNLLENQGPAVFVLCAGKSGGALQHYLETTSLGVSLTNCTVDTFTPTLGTRYSIILEYRQDLYATGNGVPWIVAPGVVTPPRVPPWSTTLSVAPYGVPLQSDNLTPNPPYGGGYFRTWRIIGGAWSCTSAGTAYAVPGTPTINPATGAIIPDVTHGADAGKVFGCTAKCQGAKLLSGPDSGTYALNSGTAAPFNITVNNVASATGFSPSGGELLIGTERMTFSSYSSGTEVIHVTARAQRGTSLANHPVGEQVAGSIEFLDWSTGFNQNSLVPNPFCVHEWPILVGPTFASVFGAPTNSFP